MPTGTTVNMRGKVTSYLMIAEPLGGASGRLRLLLADSFRKREILYEAR
jgi:hypothetical protein